MIGVEYLHSEFRSVGGWITREYLKALDCYGGTHTEDTSWHICMMETRGSIMTIARRNEIFKELQRNDFRGKMCAACSISLQSCYRLDQNVDWCMERDEQRERERVGWYDWYD